MSGYLPIVTFHAVEESASPIAFPPRRFHDLVRMIHARAHVAISLRRAVEHLAHGAPLPPRTLVLTFDDGYRSVHDEAFPLLRDLGMSATVFLTCGDGDAPSTERLPDCGGREALSWEEIRRMSEAGIEFGGHTRTHPDLTGLEDAELRAEIAAGAEMIEKETGERVRSFAYPFGRWDARVRREVMRRYDCACTDRLSVARPGHDRFTLPRVDAYYLRSPGLAGLLFSRWLPFYLGVRNVPRSTRRRLSPPGKREGDRCASA